MRGLKATAYINIQLLIPEFAWNLLSREMEAIESDGNWTQNSNDWDLDPQLMYQGLKGKTNTSNFDWIIFIE